MKKKEHNKNKTDQMPSSIQGLDRAVVRTDRNVVYHVGFFEGKDQASENNYEGHALSVCRHPEAWRKISDTTNGQTYKLLSHEATWLDYYAARQEGYSFTDWALDKGYARSSVLHRVTFYDSELGEKRKMTFLDEKKAERNAKDLPDGTVDKEQGALATDKLKERTNWSGTVKGDVLRDLAALVYVEEETRADGVWWDEKLDVNNLSAPRGGLLPDRLKHWEVQEIS